MKWYVLKYLLCGAKFSCRIRAHNFNAAMEAANAYVKDKAEILSLSVCPVQEATA